MSPHAGCLAATAPLLIYVLWNGSQRKLNYNSADENRSTFDRRRSLFVFPSHIKLAHILRKQPPPTKTTTTKLVHNKIIIIIIDFIIFIIQAQLHVLSPDQTTGQLLLIIFILVPGTRTMFHFIWFIGEYIVPHQSRSHGTLQFIITATMHTPLQQVRLNKNIILIMVTLIKTEFYSRPEHTLCTTLERMLGPSRDA